jgi:tripartite-type tricarboxylate transporter receptor subunit TctC
MSKCKVVAPISRRAFINTAALAGAAALAPRAAWAAYPEPAIRLVVPFAALASADLVGQLRQQGLEPVGGPPEEASARIKSDVVYWTKIIRDAGIKAQ